MPLNYLSLGTINVSLLYVVVSNKRGKGISFLLTPTLQLDASKLNLCNCLRHRISIICEYAFITRSVWSVTVQAKGLQVSLDFMGQSSRWWIEDGSLANPQVHEYGVQQPYIYTWVRHWLKGKPYMSLVYISKHSTTLQDIHPNSSPALTLVLAADIYQFPASTIQEPVDCGCACLGFQPHTHTGSSSHQLPHKVAPC